MNASQLIGHTSVGAPAPRIPAAPTGSSPARAGARPIAIPPLSGAPREEIAGRARRTVTAFAMDRSGSMYWAWGDPSDICGAAAESILALQRRSGGGKALIVPWGTTAPTQLVTGPMDVHKGRKALAQALRTHSTLGGNDLPAALRRVRERLPELGPDDTAVVFVLTDGIEDVTPAMHDAVRALPAGSVHVCLIDRTGGCTPEMEARWRTVPFGTFARLPHLDVRAMTAEMTDIYAAALGLIAPASLRNPTQPKLASRRPR